MSLTRNSALGLTGLLIVTPDYFTQFLEGQKTSIERVMASIRADTRHTDIFETETTSKFPAVQFPTWQMAGFPPSSFASRHLIPLLERHHGALSLDDAGDLIAFIRKIAPDFPTSPSF